MYHCEFCDRPVELGVYLSRASDDREDSGHFCDMTCLYEWVRGTSDRGRSGEYLEPWKPWRPVP